MSNSHTILDDPARLRALHAFEVLDTSPEVIFDDITRSVAQIIDVPIVLISLLDEKRQWFKSHLGLDISETPREHAFCAHAILSEKNLGRE